MDVVKLNIQNTDYDVKDKYIDALETSANAYKMLGFESTGLAVQAIAAPMFNKYVRITTSGTYTAPVTGWYRLSARGGGGGGGGACYNVSGQYTTGGGGGGGGLAHAYAYLTAGDVLTCTVGAGGTGGPADATLSSAGIGTIGGNSTITKNGTNLVNGGAGQGGAGGYGNVAVGGSPGAVNVGFGDVGFPGVYGEAGGTSSVKLGGTGGGTGGATGYGYRSPVYANSGGGGAGGHLQGRAYAGGDGAAGYITIEYFDPTL